ncbi:MAG TPA: PilZ domain-containing protein [Terriglobales bacterium]|nr:PilZ domain-containing protein [Terriglobales bacterium]
MATTKYSPTRRELRAPASGELLIEIASGGELVRGQLLDVSPHGFAIRHQHPSLSEGQEVSVVYHWGRVRARVVWVGEREGAMAAGFRTD